MKSSADLVKTKRRSSSRGACQVKNLADGKYLITANKPGYAPQTLTAYISNGQICRVYFELTPLE